MSEAASEPTRPDTVGSNSKSATDKRGRPAWRSVRRTLLIVALVLCGVLVTGFAWIAIEVASLSRGLDRLDASSQTLVADVATTTTVDVDVTDEFSGELSATEARLDRVRTALRFSPTAAVLRRLPGTSRYVDRVNDLTDVAQSLLSAASVFETAVADLAESGDLDEVLRFRPNAPGAADSVLTIVEVVVDVQSELDAASGAAQSLADGAPPGLGSIARELADRHAEALESVNAIRAGLALVIRMFGGPTRHMLFVDMTPDTSTVQAHKVHEITVDVGRFSVTPDCETSSDRPHPEQSIDGCSRVWPEPAASIDDAGFTRFSLELMSSAKSGGIEIYGVVGYDDRLFATIAGTDHRRNTGVSTQTLAAELTQLFSGEDIGELLNLLGSAIDGGALRAWFDDETARELARTIGIGG